MGKRLDIWLAAGDAMRQARSIKTWMKNHGDLKASRKQAEEAELRARELIQRLPKSGRLPKAFERKEETSN